MKINFSELTSSTPKPAKKGISALIVLVSEGAKPLASAADVDKHAGGLIKKALSAGKFTGKKGQCMVLVAPTSVAYDRIILAGIGKEAEFGTLCAQNLGGTLVQQLNAVGAVNATLMFDGIKGKSSTHTLVAHLAYGAHLRSYSFDKYFTKKPEDEKPTLATLSIYAPKAATAAKEYAASLEPVADAVIFTRDLVSEPANVIYPESLAAKCKELAKLGVTVEVLNEEKMMKLGMFSLLGVGQGSVRESQMVIMQWKGNPSDKKGPLAFVGKGVTFDTGGISIKPAGGMEEMKWDMGGAGTVIGLMKALATRKAKTNVVGVVGLVENMPDGNAQRPGDVVKSMSGQTIEVINTDAEGRLVLADALWYTQSKFKPRFIVDLATLTGAIIIALGSTKAGLFSNNDELSENLEKASKATGEEIWRLPLGDVYDKQINSDIADMKNVGEGREAGSITAAQFLQRFVNDVPWAHLDIAGVAWAKKSEGVTPKGASGFGIRLLNNLVEQFYEGK